MPWTTPTLRSVRETVRGEITITLGRASFVGNSVLRVIADASAAVCHLTLRYLDWLALQLLPDTAEHEWLDRHANIWLVNADGSIGRKVGTFAAGEVTVSGIDGTVLPSATRMSGSDNWPYETTEQVIVSTAGVQVAVRALEPGAAGNKSLGEILAFDVAIAGIDGEVPVIGIDGGVDAENDDQLRARVLRRIQQPPMGGAAYDYEAWALSIAGVERAWAAPEQGTGTITVRFLMTRELRPPDGWPTPDDVQMVSAYIDTKRPVTVKDCYVVAPIKEFIDITIANLVPNTAEVQAEIEKSIQDMLFVQAAPGQTIYAAWISYAIMNAPHVQSFQLVTDTDHVMPSLGHMAVLETILYE